MSRLFRHTLTLVLTGWILAGCAYDDVVREIRKSSDDSLPIMFENGLIDKPVITKATTLLSDHTNTMGVWGWQNSPAVGIECLFRNQEVTFNATLGKWVYLPPKYWEIHSNYQFYAYAPYSSNQLGTVATIDTITHAISIKGITLQGSNTIDSGVPELPARFIDEIDDDWMIDRTGQKMSGMLHQEVTFNMQHILSKVCVRVCRSNTFPVDSLVGLTVDSVKLEGYVSQGDYTQQFNITPLDPSCEWTQIDTLPRYDIVSAKNVSIPDSALYVLEALTIPQAIGNDHGVRIWYTIDHRNGYVDHLSYKFKLNELFTQFDTGCNYILTAIIGSGTEPIVFNGTSNDWDNYGTYLQIK